jgi:hypothetical protein
MQRKSTAVAEEAAAVVEVVAEATAAPTVRPTDNQGQVGKRGFCVQCRSETLKIYLAD